MDSSSKKSNKITEIVKLQQILKKWRRLAISNSSKNSITSTSSSSSSSNNNNNNSSNNSSNNKSSIKFLKRTLSLSNNNNVQTAGVFSGDIVVVPKGYLAVCVGEELKRFVIPTEYLAHPAFGVLLREAEEEFGFQQEGVLRIPCEVGVFEKLLKVMIEKKKKKKKQEDVFFFTEEVWYIGDHENSLGSCSSESLLSQPSQHPQSPMCR